MSVPKPKNVNNKNHSGPNEDIKLFPQSEQKLILARGLPGSGKSTWSQKWVEEDPTNRVRVNRDDIRWELFKQYYLSPDAHGTTQEKEAQVTHVQNNMVQKALKDGKHVVVDNTNLDPRVFREFGKIAAQYEAHLTNKDFPVDIEECIRRNNARDRVVPEHVIRGMQKNYMGPNGEFALFPGTYPTKPFTAPASKTDAIIFDMDGTLVNVSVLVQKYMKGKYRNFDRFHRDSLWAPPHVEVLQMAHDAAENGLPIIITTARKEIYREVTQAWLDEHGVQYENIFMRASDDNRPDVQAKTDILEEINKYYNIVHAVDDRREVIDLWKSNNIYTTEVIRDDEDLDFEPKIHNPFKMGTCIRCGKPLKNGSFIGPECIKK